MKHRPTRRTGYTLHHLAQTGDSLLIAKDTGDGERESRRAIFALERVELGEGRRTVISMHDDLAAVGIDHPDDARQRLATGVSCSSPRSRDLLWRQLPRRDEE